MADMQKSFADLEGLLSRKRAYSIAHPENKYIKEEVSILEKFFNDFIPEYNWHVNFVNSIIDFIEKFGVSESELMEILRNPEATNEQKKTAILRATAKKYYLEKEEFELKYLELYYILENRRLDLAYQKIDQDSEKLAKGNEQILKSLDLPLTVSKGGAKAA